MCRYTTTLTHRLDVSDQAPRTARGLLRAFACRTHGVTVLHTAELATTELVANAVRHGAPPITLEIGCAGRRGLRVRVNDASPRHPRLRRPGPEETGGRGVALVDLLTDGWGVAPLARGKAVWFTLRPVGDRS